MNCGKHELPERGFIKTKAIIAEKETDMSYFILGNETHKLTEQNKNEKSRILNAVITQSQSKMKTKSVMKLKWLLQK